MPGNEFKPLTEPRKFSEHFRRTDPRYDRRLEVEIVAADARQKAFTRNLSLGGVLVETMCPLAVRTSVVVRFRIPAQGDAIEVTGEVRWVEAAGPATSMGIRFHGLRAREVWALNRFFQS